MVSALCQGMSVGHAELNEARALAIPAADQELCSSDMRARSAGDARFATACAEVVRPAEDARQSALGQSGQRADPAQPSKTGEVGVVRMHLGILFERVRG